MGLYGTDMKNRCCRKAGQSLLDFVLVFGVLLTLLAGFTRIWVWFNSNFAKRNVDYQNTRLAAGTSNSRARNLNYSDKPLAIDDNWVFRGKASGTVGMPPIATTVIDVVSGEGGDDGTGRVCSSGLSAASGMCTQATTMQSEADDLQEMHDRGDDWTDIPYFYIYWALGIDVDKWEEAANNLYKAAELVREKAVEIANASCRTNTYTSCDQISAASP
jgi:hypothetical protein